MSETNMFEKASKQKLRFDTSKGKITTEDLWALPLESPRGGVSLDSVAISLSKAIKDSEDESFVVKKSKTSNTLELKLDIVKHIIQYKLDLAAKQEQAAVNKVKREKIEAALAELDDKELQGKSKEDLLKELAALQNA